MNVIKCLLILGALTFCACDDKDGFDTQPTNRVHIKTRADSISHYWTTETMPDGHSYVFVKGNGRGMMSHNPECSKCN